MSDNESYGSPNNVGELIPEPSREWILEAALLEFQFSFKRLQDLLDQGASIHDDDVFFLTRRITNRLEDVGMGKPGNERKALEAWKRWWESAYSEHYGTATSWHLDQFDEPVCFFCGSFMYADGFHEEDCPYLIVKQIAEEEGW